jgi:nifR3 family TIM-barrel protein
MKIGNTELLSGAALAPMAGVADRAFRELCVSFGAVWCVGEMVSSKGLIMHDRKSAQLLTVSAEERPMAVQLFGCEPLLIAQAAEQALAFSPEAIDINMGCPAPKINSNGGGAVLMKNPALCGEITKAAVSAAGGTPVTVKIRKGWDDSSVNAVEVAKICEDAGAAAVTVHGRTRMQMYAPKADWEIIGAVKRAVSIPVIGNGDITSAQEAARMLEQTNCDGVMIGRAALGNPWIFSQVSAFLSHERVIPEVGLFEKMRVMHKHISLLCEYKGEYVGMREARKHTAYYMRGLSGAARLRVMCGKLTYLSDLGSLIEAVMRENYAV